MSETTATLLDLGAEAAVAPHEYLIVAAATLGALVYLGRGVLLKRRRMLSGEGCGACGGCGGASACRRVPGPTGDARRDEDGAGAGWRGG